MKKLLLHSCCAVCTIGALHALKEIKNTEYDTTLYFCNDNIDNFDEFERRLPLWSMVSEIVGVGVPDCPQVSSMIDKGRQNAAPANTTPKNQNFLNNNSKLIIEPYNHEKFLSKTKGFESEKEGGRRCKKCFELRLQKTFEKAKELNFDYFSTTLTISPHKNSQVIFECGERLQVGGAEFLKIDFKKNDNFRKAIELSKKYGIYRQNYCGCEFSKRY
ncbi:MAG: epoxyqueuosine reductase QueH [Firmicutes bacterium]|nr:epoxyqueuosine reductase QueH [Bacillota bacterium]